MSLFRIMDIAGSALAAQSVRLNVTASNMANADSISSSVDATYRARHPVFAAMIDAETGSFNLDPIGAGVQVEGVIESQAPLRSVYQPDHPLADVDGYIHMPNVNMVEEMANMISASRSYQTNVEVANAAKQMMLRTIALGQ
jgi:flagellar basal-body rod protein FlgC